MNLTPAERILWRYLKNKQLGTKFIPQRPIGPFIVDFCCSEHNLIIELDGDSHNWDGEPEYDEQRSAFLEGLGWKILRYTNHEVRQNIEGVVTHIQMQIEGRDKEG
jgi:very-short-patch-repair endonuclease